MTIGEAAVGGTHELATRVQTIRGDYYNITDAEGWPIAALLVLVDGKRNPVRAELHLYEELADDLRESAFRQGRALLENRYFSAEPVPLRVMQSYPLGDTLQVRANAASPPPVDAQWFQRWQLAAGAGVLVLLIALVWALAAFLRGPANTGGTGSETPTAQTQTNTDANAANSGDTQAAAPAPQSGELPPSQHADPNLAVGKRIRVRPELKLSLVAEPGPDKTVVGYMENAQEATIVAGPALTQGTSDTIVWWQVQLDDGSQAWAPANTSEGAVLELVE